MLHLPLENSMDSLIFFLKQENELLRKMKASEAERLFAQKHELMKVYEDLSQQVRDQTHDFQDLASHVKKNMLDKTQILNELLHENAHLTKRILQAHTYYLETLKKVAAKRLGIDAETYTSKGKKIHPVTMSGKSAPPHLTMDRAL